MKPIWTSEQIIGQLTNWDGKWDNSVPIPFMFYGQPLPHHEFSIGFKPFNAAEQQSLLRTMQLVSDVANIGFFNLATSVQVPGFNNPFIGFYTINTATAAFWGAATRYVTQGTSSPEPMGRIYGVDVVVNHNRADVQGGWAIGDSNSRKLMHELLHTLGLDHAGNYNGDSAAGYEKDAIFYQDSNQYTVMSYWAAAATGAKHTTGGVVQFASTPLLYDVAALQKLYGANMATRTSDTVYGFNNTSGRDAYDLNLDPSAIFTIWDGGGSDTLDLSGYATSSRIDLHEGAFSDAGGMTLNISIAFGAAIENAVGGLGNDTIGGNALANLLLGGVGNDLLLGGGGSDTLVGGAGIDTFIGSLADFAGDTIADLSETDRVLISDASLFGFTISRDGDKLALPGGSLTLSGLGQQKLLVRTAVEGGVDLTLSTVSTQFGDPNSVIVNNFAIGAGGWSSQDRYPRHVADVNGDGFRDIVGFGEAGVLVSLGSANGAFSGPGLALANFGQASGWASDNQFHRELADVNADGRADVVGFGIAGTWIAFGRADGSFSDPIKGVSNFGAEQGWATQDGFARTVGDVNGDGKADLVGFGYGGTLVLLGNGDGTYQDMKFGLANFGVEQGWISDNSFHRTLADVNGDGADDIIGLGNAGVWVALSRADGTFQIPQLALENFGRDQGWISQDAYARHAADVNGDGIADIVGFGVAGTLVAYGQANGSFTAARFDVQNFGAEQGWTSDNSYHRDLADINNDGTIDIVGFGQVGTYVGFNQVYLYA
jgi:hypothetical protein